MVQGRIVRVFAPFTLSRANSGSIREKQVTIAMCLVKPEKVDESLSHLLKDGNFLCGVIVDAGSSPDEVSMALAINASAVDDLVEVSFIVCGKVSQFNNYNIDMLTLFEFKNLSLPSLNGLVHKK